MQVASYVVIFCFATRPTWVQSQTQNKAQWLAACGHVTASSQSLRFIFSLRMNSSFITSRPESNDSDLLVFESSTYLSINHTHPAPTSMLKRQQSKEESKDLESTQSSTTPDPGYRMGKWQKHKQTSHTKELISQTFPRRRPQGCMTQTRQYGKNKQKI